MSDFNKVCKAVEQLDVAEYTVVLAAKTAKIVPALHELTQDYEEVAHMLAAFMVASVYADGKLDETEYLLMKPMMEIFFGTDFDYASAKAVVKAFRPEGNELKEIIDYLIDILGEISPELKDDIITVCLLICAIDGKISRKEKQFIKQLIR